MVRCIRCAIVLLVSVLLSHLIDTSIRFNINNVRELLTTTDSAQVRYFGLKIYVAFSPCSWPPSSLGPRSQHHTAKQSILFVSSPLFFLVTFVSNTRAWNMKKTKKNLEIKKKHKRAYNTHAEMHPDPNINGQWYRFWKANERVAQKRRRSGQQEFVCACSCVFFVFRRFCFGYSSSLYLLAATCWIQPWRDCMNWIRFLIFLLNSVCSVVCVCFFSFSAFGVFWILNSAKNSIVFIVMCVAYYSNWT